MGAILVAVLLAALAVSTVYGEATAQAKSGKTAVLIRFDHQLGPVDQALVRGAGGDISHIPAGSGYHGALLEGTINGLSNNP